MIFKIAAALAVLSFVLMEGVTPLVFWFMFSIYVYDIADYYLVRYLYNMVTNPKNYKTLEELLGPEEAARYRQEIEEIFKGNQKVKKEEEED